MNHLDRNSLSKFAAVATKEYKRFAPIDSAILQSIHTLRISCPAYSDGGINLERAQRSLSSRRTCYALVF
jgi:hypothetical protein